MGIGSILKAGIKELPDDTVVPAQSVSNLLKKKGVKDEELEFSGVELPKEGKVTKADLVKMEEGRKDIFSTEYANNYNWVSLKPGRNNPTYKEKITTYSEKGAVPKSPIERARDLGWTEEKGSLDEWLYELSETAEDSATRNAAYRAYGELDSPGVNRHEQGSRYTSSHFEDVPNYLMHTRIYDDTIDGVPTRVVTEIQSDLHQAGRQQGYTESLTSEERSVLQQYIDTGDVSLVPEVARIGGATEDMVEPGYAQYMLDMPDAPPKSPFEKTWLRKGIEREVTDAIEEGRGQIAIPISGAVDDLQRAPGVQKWYETNVVSTAKKLAKSSGMDFELKTVGAGVDPEVARLAALWNVRDLDRAIETITDDEVKVLSNFVHERAGPGDYSVEELLEEANDLVSQVPNDAVTYAVIKPKTEALTEGERITLKMDPGSDEAKAIRDKLTPSFALYASPAATAFVAYQALSTGMPQDDVELMLSEEGFDANETMEILQNAQAIANMKAEGYSDEEIAPLLQQDEIDVGESKVEPVNEIEPLDLGRVSDAYRDLMGDEEMPIQQVLAKMETVYPDDSYVTTNIAGFFGDKESQRISDESRLAQRKRIISTFNKKLGIELEWDGADWVVIGEDGTREKVTPEWWRGFTENKFGIAGGVATGVPAYRAGLNAARATPGPWPAKLGAGFLAASGVTAVGATAGAELDYLHNAMMIQQDFEARAMARVAMTATEMSVIGDAVVGGVIKMGKGSWNTVTKAVNFIRNGDFDRATLALKETFFLTDDETADLTKKLSRVAKVPGKSSSEKAIAATALTKPGAEELVAASVHATPRASRAVVKAVDDRAQDLLTNTNALRGEDVGRFIREDFEGYRTLVKEGYERVKVQAATAPNANAFRFNYDKIAIEPVLERLGKNIENKDLAYKFAKQSERIRSMSKTRRLSDLIELRKLVNEFRYNNRISNSKDFEMLDNIKSGIDRSIQLGADITMEDPKGWMTGWRAANRQYSEMKTLEKNILFKAITADGVSDADIGSALTKYAVALDDTFVSVVERLPKKSRVRVEGAVLDTLADKYTQGAVDGVRATDFPALMEDLKLVNFRTPEARSMKKAINELAEVFKNDIPLSNSAGGIQAQKVQQAMTDSLEAKARFALASEVFHHIRGLVPDAKGRASSLVLKTAKLLNDPVNSKSIKELQELLDGEINLDAQIEEVVKRAALAKSQGSGMPRVKLYGDGKVLVGKGAGKEHSVPIHRIAPKAKVKEISEATGIHMSDKKGLDMELRKRGYIATELGADKVRLLGE